MILSDEPKIELFNRDCVEALKKFGDHQFELAIVDPPYFSGPNKSGYYGKGYSSLGVKRAKYYGTISDDCWKLPDKKYFKELFRVSKNQIIWGANHFANEFSANSPSWIVWDKVNGSSTFADAELAYTSFSTAVRIFKYMWNGMHQGSFGGNVQLNEKRIHPTQKPVKLYEWLLMNYAKEGDHILDTHLGSGSIAIACNRLGFELTAFELDEEYYNASIKRFKNVTSQTRIF